MGRKKQEVQKYHFNDFVSSPEDVVRAKYPTDGDIVNAVRNIKDGHGNTDYYVGLAIQRYDASPTTFSFRKDTYRWVRKGIIETAYKQFCVQERADLDKRFAEWFNSREDAKEIWSHFIPNTPNNETISVHTYDGVYYSNSTWAMRNNTAQPLSAIAAAPPDYNAWDEFINDWQVAKYVELQREPSYEIGDLILLRAPFVGNYRHDPMYGQDVSVPRLGTIVEYKDELYRGGRRANSKGNRNVNVLWMNTSDIRKIGEKYIKLECRKGRNVKVVK